VSELAPGIPIDVIMGGIMGGFLLVLFKAPLMVILLVATLLQARLELIALILLAVAVVMVVLPYVMAAMARLQPTDERASPGSTT
jgi:membrane protein implicated in regulation of membrane protease activity